MVWGGSSQAWSSGSGSYGSKWSRNGGRAAAAAAAAASESRKEDWSAGDDSRPYSCDAYGKRFYEDEGPRRDVNLSSSGGGYHGSGGGRFANTSSAVLLEPAPMRTLRTRPSSAGSSRREEGDQAPEPRGYSSGYDSGYAAGLIAAAAAQSNKRSWASADEGSPTQQQKRRLYMLQPAARPPQQQPYPDAAASSLYASAQYTVAVAASRGASAREPLLARGVALQQPQQQQQQQQQQRQPFQQPRKLLTLEGKGAGKFNGKGWASSSLLDPKRFLLLLSQPQQQEAAPSKESLDGALDRYFGKGPPEPLRDATKGALDNQLDQYFGKSASAGEAVVPIAAAAADTAAQQEPSVTVATKGALDSQMDQYFGRKPAALTLGVAVAGKQSLDNQLDSYFGDKKALPVEEGEGLAEAAEAVVGEASPQDAGAQIEVKEELAMHKV